MSFMGARYPSENQSASCARSCELSSQFFIFYTEWLTFRHSEREIVAFARQFLHFVQDTRYTALT
jgi:hypothetical protein